MKIHNKSKLDLKNSMHTFDSLKREISTELNDAIRYERTKIFYEKYPDNSISFIKDMLITDFNYNFRILEFSKVKRYSVNDLLNSIIIRSRDKAQMANDIINNNLIWFALSWKDFSIKFAIFYDLHLGAFILFHKGTETVVYLCSRAADPFQHIQGSKEITLSKSYRLNKISRKSLLLMVDLLNKLLNVQKKELMLTFLNTEKGHGLPQYKLASPLQEIIIYFGTLSK
jgi:hypothetical protein